MKPTHARRLAFRILALVFLAQVEALDAELPDLERDRLVDLALDPGEVPAALADAALELLGRHLQQACRLRQPGIVEIDVAGLGPDALRHHAGRQDGAIAVEHAAAAGRQIERARIAHLALVPEKSLPSTCTQSARPAMTLKPRAIRPTTARLRPNGVLLASSGLLL